MDKRTLLFMICISLAFFGVQAWFGPQHEAEKKAHEQKMAEQKAVKQREKEIQVSSRTAKAEDLPLVEIYANPNGDEKVGAGLSCGNHYFVLAWKESLPEKLYVKKGNSFESVHLSTKGCKANEPALYAKPGAAPLALPAIPTDRPVDLQLVAFNGETEIALGEQRGNAFSLPFHYLGAQAIALLKEGDAYLPVGIYEPGAKQIKPMRDYERLRSLVRQSQAVPSDVGSDDERFYVLETPYQQLVFSTRGGSLAEINLPMKGKNSPLSIVKEIDIDRQILKNSPQNARFPLHRPYATVGNASNQESALGGYYPLLRRSVLHPDGTVKTAVSSEYYALNIVGDDPQIAQLNYKVTRFEPNSIRFESTTGQRKIVKTYSIPKENSGPYCLDLEIRIEGDARGLWLSSGIPDVEWVGGSYSPLLKFQAARGKVSEVETIDLPKKGPVQVTSIATHWVSNCNGFLGLILDPLQETGQGYQAMQIDGNLVPTRLSLIDPAHNSHPPANYPGYAAYLPLKSGVSMPFRIFAGPFDENLLADLDNLHEKPDQNYNPDYASAQDSQGWFSFISQPFSKFLFLLMQFFYTITHSWAASIILLTIALRIMMYPLNAWSIRSSIRMQQLAPKVKAIQDKYKKDPKKAQLEVMNLYRESGANPLTGCFPMLLQMPFLIGMFYLLKTSFQLRGAVFIPGWIDDLAAPDVLFTWNQPIWFIGNEFHLLPILMGLSMYLQQRITNKLPKDPKQLSDTQKQQKMMGIFMSVAFTVMFYNFPSGLNLYFMFSTLLAILQQWWMMRKMELVPQKK